MQSTRRTFLHQAAAGTLAAGATTLLLPAESAWAQTGGRRIPSSSEVRKHEKYLWVLVDLINAYRKENRLHAVPISAKLTLVAATHVKDLAEKEPHKQCGNNLHSWSQSKHWTGGCFNLQDKRTWPMMWNKPKEIAGYAGRGFENSATGVRNGEPSLEPEAALDLWKNSQGHNDLLLNRGTWAKRIWRAVGAVCNQGYACAWFGDVADP